MGLISKIIYGNKSNAIPVVNRLIQATAEDFNEIKEVVNNCVDGINWIKSDEVQLAKGNNTVLFLSAYPFGVPFAIIVHNCYNTRGYLVAHTITNKNITGFDISVGEACILTYLSVPKR